LRRRGLLVSAVPPLTDEEQRRLKQLAEHWRVWPALPAAAPLIPTADCGIGL